MNSFGSFWGGDKTASQSNGSATAVEPSNMQEANLPVNSRDGDDAASVLQGTTQPDSTASVQIPCPDPSAHVSQDPKLSGSGANAALYKTDPAKGTSLHGTYPLDKDGKLSSAGAATSLKHARASDLPGFPVVGIDKQSAAGAAASLGWANQKPFEHWKPDASAHAGKAALLAHDYKMKPLWQPELSEAGSRAALLAHRGGPKLDLWQPEASKEGNSAAGLAMKNKSLSPQLDYGYTVDGKKGALLAAKGAVGRSRSGSSPLPVKNLYPDAHNAPFNALNAATVAHKPSTRSIPEPEDADLLESEAMQSARVTHLRDNVSSEMFREHPPIRLEVEEKRKSDALRGASISMARQMQQVMDDTPSSDAFNEGQSAAVIAGNRQSMQSTRSLDIKQQAMQYIHLQEAAHKLAAERIAKIDAEDHSAYRKHYGFNIEPSRSRLSIRNRNLHRRASSEGKAASTTSDDDEFRSRRIRHQMSQFHDQVAQVDAKKRQKDRENLLAAAERKVQSRMHALDERVFAETGKVSPAMMEEWDAKARAKAAKESEKRMENHGMVDIGGGKFLDQSEINRIAAERVQPTLDEVNHQAEQHRARDEEARLDEEEKKRQATTEREREKDLKAGQKRAKDEEKRASKQKKEEEKQARKAEKEAEKTKKAEDKQVKKEEKRRSKEVKRESAISPTAAAAGGATETGVIATTTGSETEQNVAEPTTARDSETEVSSVDSAFEDSPEIVPAQAGEPTNIEKEDHRQERADQPTINNAQTNTTISDSTSAPAARDIGITSRPSEEASPIPPSSPNKPSPIKTFFTKLRRKSKSASDRPKSSGAEAADPSARTLTTYAAGADDSTNRTSSSVAPRSSTTTTDDPKPSFEPHPAVAPPVNRESTSLEDSEDDAANARRSVARESGISGASAEFEEARDGFDEEGLAPPRSGAWLTGKGVGSHDSPVRETRFHEEV
ncbi:MAG: hypothetical protein M1820_006568 [Bogoriella megaspora]|nr:MAG: hypothetical protein M1820_006568 [Bogoriella megaspora]